MKKLIKTLSILMMSAMLILPAAVSTQAEEVDNDTKEVVEYNMQEAPNGFISTNNVNLRKGPNTSTASLGQLNYQDLVYATNVGYDYTGRKWYYCKVLSGNNKGKEGYVAAEYVAILVDLD